MGRQSPRWVLQRGGGRGAPAQALGSGLHQSPAQEGRSDPGLRWRRPSLSQPAPHAGALCRPATEARPGTRYRKILRRGVHLCFWKPFYVWKGMKV